MGKLPVVAWRVGVGTEVTEVIRYCRGQTWRFLDMKYFSHLLILLLVVSFATTDSYGEDSEKEREVVKIGAIIPLTGGQAARGQDIAKLLKTLERHFDEMQLGYHYRFIVEDGQCGAGHAATTAAMKLINIDKVKFLLTGCSGETLQAGPLAERNKILNIAVLSLHQDVKTLGDYVFRTFIDIEKSVQGFADFMDSKCGGKIAVLTEENAFTFGVRDLLLKHLGAKVVYAENFTPDSSDFSTLLAKADARGARGVYLNVMSERTLANLVNDIKRRRLSQTLFSYNFPEVASFRTATEKNSDNLYFIGAPDINNSSSEFQSVQKEFNSQHPGGPTYEFVLRTTSDAVKSIVDAISVVSPDPTKVKDYLYSYSTLGALGKVEYDSNGDIKDLNYVLKRVGEDGKNEIIGELVKPSS